MPRFRSDFGLVHKPPKFAGSSAPQPGLKFEVSLNQPHPSTTTEFPFTTVKMSSRPTVGILGADGASSGETLPLPAVFSSPIRPDIVQYENHRFLQFDDDKLIDVEPSTLEWPRTRDNHMP